MLKTISTFENHLNAYISLLTLNDMCIEYHIEIVRIK